MNLFGTAGIRGSAEAQVTPALALTVGRAMAAEIRATTTDLQTEVVVARDGRVTGSALAAAMEAGIAAGGVAVARAGQLPTPGLAHASQGRYGVVVTASHNPPGDNGIKLFKDGTEFDDDLEAAIETRIEDAEPPTSWEAWTTSTTIDPIDTYLDDVVSYARGLGAELDGLRVAVDCGNGMAALATPIVLRELGAEVVTLNGNVDGHFPGRGSKPTPETLTDLRAFIADANTAVERPGRDGAGFAFGIAHDGDADRIVIVDPTGEVVHEDTVLAILAEHYTRECSAADPVVVTTPNASGRIDERVGAAGGRVERVRLGALHEGIRTVRTTTANASQSEIVVGDAPDERSATDSADTVVTFAAEPWKHIHTGFGDWIDGVCSAVVLARLVAAEGLDTLREPVTERPYRKVSVDCPDDKKTIVMDQLATTLPDAFPEATVDTEHGIRLTFPDASWTLVRPSGTEAYVRVYAESEHVDDLVDDVTSVLTNAIEMAD